MPLKLPQKREMVRISDDDYWDSVRSVKIGGRRAVRRWVSLRPEHRRWQTYGLGAISAHDVGRVLVVDAFQEPGSGQSIIDVIQDEPPAGEAASTKGASMGSARKGSRKIKFEMPEHGSVESRAIDRELAEVREIEGAPLEERREAREAFYQAMRDPALVAERIGWLIDGNYGQGQMLQALRVLASPRMNRRAALTHMVGLYEWRCPGAFAAEAWKRLTASEKRALDAAVDVVIEHAEQELSEEQGG